MASRHEKSTFEVGPGIDLQRCTDDDDMVPAATLHHTQHCHDGFSALFREEGQVVLSTMDIKGPIAL